MKRIKIIPAIDIIQGRCVRLTQGDYTTEKIYAQDPIAIAKNFEDCGIRNLHMVDLDGARIGKIINARVLEQVCTRTSLEVDFGGGIKTDEDIKLAFDSGARQVTGGSIAVKEPEQFKKWLDQYGPDRMILGADVKRGRVAISGWQEESALELKEFLAQYAYEGIKYVICTDISRDGELNGPALELYKELVLSFPQLRFIASGGVCQIDDIWHLEQAGLYGAILGKAIYEKRIQLKDLVNQFIL